MTGTSAIDHSPNRLEVGVTLWLASELMFFAGLFAAYFTLRAVTSPWPPAGVELSTGRAAMATALLLLSSVTMVRAERSLGVGRNRSARRWLLSTLALGAAFVSIQALEYGRLGFGMGTHTYGSVFYLMTGFHGLHVLVGLFLIGTVSAAVRTGANPGFVRAIALYWHFVDAVWVGLFATLYLLR